MFGEMFGEMISDPGMTGPPSSSLFSPFIGHGGGYAQLIGLLAPFAALLPQSFFSNAVWLFLLGSLIEAGRRVFSWISERFRIQYYLTAKFHQGDPAYEWVVNFLTEENVWRSTCEFDVTAKNSMRKWGISPGASLQNISRAAIEGNADYVPQYLVPQLFRWKGHWIEIKKEGNDQLTLPSAMRRHLPLPMQGPPLAPMSTLKLNIYTRRLSALSELVEEARLRYLEMCRPHVIVHVADLVHANTPAIWNNIKRKPRRPVNSVILGDGVMESLLEDMQEFLKAEDWYHEAGIPHRRGFLLEGPPGTGKTSTIYSLAGELGLEIFSLSLSSGFLDDIGLQHAVSCAPKGSILVIEDIDCAFPSRDEDEEEEEEYYPCREPFGSFGIIKPQKTAVTLSGLLNVIDGVGSDEGKIFFTTTNYVDRLDPALLRPGRIDRRIRYGFATPSQGRTMFQRFFSEKRFGHIKPSTPDNANRFTPSDGFKPLDTRREKSPPSYLSCLADKFASGIPDRELTTAELQGYLLGHKKDPVAAAREIGAWVELERAEKVAREEREKNRKECLKGKKERMRHCRSSRHGGLYPAHPVSMAHRIPTIPSLPDSPVTPM